VASRRPLKAAARKHKAAAKPKGHARGLRLGLDQKTRELNEALEQQAAAAEVLKAISSAADLEAVLSLLVQSAAKLCHADRAAIRLLRDGALHHLASHGLSAQQREFMSKTPLPAKPGPSSIAGRVLMQGGIVQIENVKADPTLRTTVQPSFADIHTALGVPLMRGAELIGIFIFSRKTVERFTRKQIALVSTFADQAVIAIENARLLDELRQSLDRQTATSEVLKVISASPGNLQPIFAAILENATRICEANFGGIFQVEDGGPKILAELGFPPDFMAFLREKPRAGPLHPQSRVVATRRSVHIVDYRQDQAYLGRDPMAIGGVEIGGIRTLLTVPMLKDEVLVGIMAIFRKEVRPFSAKQIELVENFAAQAVIAIENARLLNELRERTDDLTESLEQQTATSEVLRVISRSPGELEPVFNSMLENATRICEAKFGVLYRYDGTEFHADALLNVPPGLAEHLLTGPRVPTPDSGIGRLARLKRTVHIEDVRAEPAYVNGDPLRRATADLGGARTFVAVPMLKDTVLLGAFVIFRQEVRPFTDKQIALVENFAAQAVIAIENTRLLSELRQSLEQQTATAEVLKVISSSPGELQPVFQATIDNATRLCGAKFGGLSLREGGVFRSLAVHGVRSTYLEERLRDPIIRPMPGHNLERLLRTRATVHIPDLASDVEAAQALFERAGARALLNVPLLKGGDVLGSIMIYREEPGTFADKQIELVENFAAQAVIAIENARLLNELRQRTDDLSKSLEELRTAQDRLVQTEKLASLGQLTAGIAHEIKNPLNFVNNFSSLSVELIDELQEELAGVSISDEKRGEITELADTLKGNLDKIAQHGKRADAIVKNMLLHSREGAGEHRPVDVNALVEESLNLAYHGARAEKQGFNITLERCFDATAGEADLYPQEVTRVLLNIIANGFYAAHKRKGHADGDTFEPKVIASTKNLGDRVEIRIRDNGTGIPPEVREKIFNPFFTTKPAGEGTGLGLSISHDIIVKQHSGTIAVETVPGQFTEFTVVLPRQPASLDKPAGTA
jgi:GAF domain-containing protein